MLTSDHKCPCCDEKISFNRIFLVKNDREYFCKKCGKVSAIKLKKSINNLVTALILMCVVSVFVFSFVVRMLFFGAVVTLLLFIGFYLLVPSFLVITKKK